jgi:hypothetical protein
MILGVIKKLRSEKGGVGYILLWVMGVPLPVLLLISLLRGCN